MKRFLLFLLTASFVHAQTFPVKVDADGDVLHDIIVSTTNPTGVVNFATGKLLINGVVVTTGGGGGGAPVDATYIAETSNGTLTNEFALGSLVTGILKNTTTTGIPTIAVPGVDYVSPNAGITGATKTKITYDAKGLVTSGADATTADINDSIDRRYVTDAQRTVIQNTSGTNTGDQNLSGFVQNTRTISTTVPLTGGGDLSANRTIAINNAAADGSTKGAASFTANDFDATSGNVSLDYVNGQKATSSLPGFLSAADWTTFNAKGTVTSFSAGDLSPLFTTTEATITTTPALSFALSTAAANTFFGNGTGSTAVPTFMSASTARTALGLAIGTNVEAWDADLDALAAASRVGAIYYRSTSTPSWDPVKYGAGIQFVNGVLSTVSNQAQLVPEATKSSSSTLNVSGETFTNYDITGTINISAITLEEGRTVLLRFTGAGLTLTQGASLLLPGNVPILTDVNSWGLFYGGASSVVTCTYFQKGASFTAEGAFENVYAGRLKPRNPPESLWMDFSSGPDSIAWVKSDGSGFIFWDMGLLTSTKTWTMPNATGALAVVETDFASVVPRFHAIGATGHLFEFPDHPGTVLLEDGTQTVTNKTIDASQLVDGTVTLAKQANMATASVLYRKTAGSGIPEVNTLATLKTDLGLTGTNSGDQTIMLTGDVTGSGTGSFAATVAAIAGAFNLTGDITPPALPVITNDNYAPTGFSTASTVRLSTGGTGNKSITGLAGGVDGKIALLHNTESVDVISLGALDPGSLAANQFATAVDLNPGDSVFLRYDATSLLWRLCVPHLDTSTIGIAWSQIYDALIPGTDLQNALNLKVSIDANANSASNNFISGYATTATAAGTTTLTVASAQTQYFTGSTTQICKLPVTSTLVLNHTFRIVNNSTGAVTINSSGSNAVKILAGGTSCIVTCILTSGTTAASWDANYDATSFTTGTKMTFPVTSASIARTDNSNTFTGDQTFNAKIIGGAQIRLKGYTVAALPTGTQGDTAFVTDALAPTFLAVIVGGGSVVSPVFYNGTNWVGY